MPNYVRNEIHVTGDRKMLEQLTETVKGEKSAFSFDCIIPMPKSMNIQSSSDEEKAILLILKGGMAHTSLIPKQYRDSVRKAASSANETLKNMKVYDFTDDYGLDNYMSDDDPAHANIASIMSGESPVTKADFIALGAIAIDNYICHGSRDWYDWCSANWGTKWDAENAGVALAEDRLSIRFNTAWALPDPVLAKLVEMFPALTFEGRWADEDIGSNCGTWFGINGKMEVSFLDYGEDSIRLACDIWDYDPEEYFSEEDDEDGVDDE